jgi:Leucine rich repeat variant
VINPDLSSVDWLRVSAQCHRAVIRYTRDVSRHATPFPDEFDPEDFDLEEDELERRWKVKLQACLDFCRDPTSPSRGLRELYSRASSQTAYPIADEIMTAIAKNPNIDLLTVKEVAYYQPELLLENPVLDVLNFENPRWLDRMDEEERQRFVARAAPRLVFTLHSDTETLHAFADSPTATEAQLRLLAESPESSVPLHVLDNPNCPLDLLERFAGSENVFERAAVAENPSTPSEFLERLSFDDAWYVLRVLCNHPSLTPTALERVSVSLRGMFQESPDLIRSILMDRHDEGVVLEILAADSRVWVREGVARHPNAPEAVLKTLMRDASKRVAKAARGNWG